MVLFIISVAAIFFIMPIAALFPLMTINHFAGGTFQVSIIEVGWGLGALAGGLVLGIKRLRMSRIYLISSMYVLLGLTFALSGILPESGFWIFLMLTSVGGVTMLVYSGAFMVVLQTNIETSALGRVFSIYGSLSLLPSIIGLLYTGIAAERIGVANAFLIAGIALIFLGVYSFFDKTIKQFVILQKGTHPESG